MKSLLVLITTVFAMSAFGHGNQAHSTLGNDNNINNCNPTIVCKPRVIYMTHKQAARIKALEAEVKRLNGELDFASEREREVTKFVEIVVEKTDKKMNSISLLVPYGPTDLEVKKSGNTVEARNVNEWDLGLMYQRADVFGVDDLRGSFGVTAQGTALGGIGVDF